ncbi:MAG: glycosyltransferase [Caulobacteraceae bacterium]
MAEPRVDVLLPIYNAADTLEESIRSIQAQTVGDFRVLAIDDGSTDGTPDLLSRLAREDPRIEVVRKTNGGIVDALNHGISLSRAPLIARHDADDLSYPERFAEQVRYLDEHPDCVAVSGCARHVDGAGQPVGTYAILAPPDNSDPTAIPSREPYLMHPFVTIRREALVRAGGYRYVFHSEDTDLYWRLLEIGPMHNLPFLVGDYRIHGASISSASVLNGRIAATASQLAALSHLRRQAGLPDLVFEASRLAAYKRAETLPAIVDEASRDLDEHEAAYLRVAVAAKLMELASYRPYQLSAEDYAFIRAETEQAMGSLRSSDRNNIRWLRSGCEARLLRRLALSQFLAFTPLADYPMAIARAILKRPGVLKAKAPPPPRRAPEAVKLAA